MSDPATASAYPDLRDPALADAGKRRIEWAFLSMPVLQTIRKRFIRDQPLAGVSLAACLHVTAETANLAVTLRDGGATVSLCGPSPLTSQDDAAACLIRDYGIRVQALRGTDIETWKTHVRETLEPRPTALIDHGATFAALLREAEGVTGAVEVTATGAMRMRKRMRDGSLHYPVVTAAEAWSKRLFDHGYGTGQSTIDAIVRATNRLLAGSTVVIAGYGWCGRGIAGCARGMGASVIVTEVEPTKALEAVMDGYRVMTMADAAAAGDLFVTATGNRSVLARDHFDKLKDGAVLCNAGREGVEIDLDALARTANARRTLRDGIEEFKMRDGRRLYVLAEGTLINLAAEGHPAAAMDMSFASQALSLEYLVKNRSSLGNEVYAVPEAIDKQVARMKLDAMGVAIDRLTIDQERYLAALADGH